MSAGRPIPHPQIERLAQELDQAGAQARTLTSRLSDEALHQRPQPKAWSAAECLAHLNLTSQAMLPVIDKAITECSNTPRLLTRIYRRDPIGWFLSRALEPPYKQKFKTIAKFVSTSAGSGNQLIREFSEMQGQLIQRLNRAAGLDLGRVKVTSVFNRGVRYNLYSAFRIITAHQRRHLYQAEMSVPK